MGITRHSRIEDGVRLTVDERSISSFKRHVDALVRSVGDFAEEDLMDFCEDVLSSANELVPIDTGALAESAGYHIAKKDGEFIARMGYGVVKNHTNPRTGKKASSYAGTVHEDLTVNHENGEAKFFEKALAMHAANFYDKMGHDLRDSLAHFTARQRSEKTFKSEEAREAYLKIMQRKTSGFTAQHGGRILPYPLGSNRKTKWTRTGRDAHGIRSKVRNKYARKDSQHAYGYRPEESNLRGSYGFTSRKLAYGAGASKRAQARYERYQNTFAKKARGKRASVNKVLRRS